MTSKKPSLIQPIEDYSVTKPPVRQSDFDNEMKKAKDTETEKNRLAAVTIDDDAPDFERDDEYGHSRLHCWVLLQKGNREIQETFFIEPTTGRRYNIDDAPYYSVEGIFNHKNFWINLDPTRSLDEINFDF
jgi:hypothetical protein